MDRQKFAGAVKSNLENNIYNHSLSLEACMFGLYDYFKSNNLLADTEPTREEWGIAGLIHDIDFAGDTKELHPLRTREVLAKYGLEINNTVQQIILSHDKRQGISMDSKAKWSIYCADSLTGLITAVAFVYPDRKLASVKVSSVLKRFLKEPKFAAGTRRDEVTECTNPDGLNLPLEKFIEICLTSMQKIATEIGL
ncbi:phosphohydrolase [Candidatus Shapirobacteria bacterium]|nr:phosphohydrolase [Candidatus Shapirobacteria bacterium]